MTYTQELLIIIAIAGPVLSIGTAYGIIQGFKRETERRLEKVEDKLIENRMIIDKHANDIIELKGMFNQTKNYMKDQREFMIDFRTEYRNNVIKFDDRFADYDKNIRDFYEKYSPILNPKQK